MNIKEIKIKGFKSIGEIVLKSPSPFSVFVGANGAGKSNIFEALEFLYLNDNKLKSLDLEGSLPELEVLHLRANGLNFLPTSFLMPMPRLETLYLHGNPLPDTLRGTRVRLEAQEHRLGLLIWLGCGSVILFALVLFVLLQALAKAALQQG